MTNCLIFSVVVVQYVDFKKDGVELARSFERHALCIGLLDESDNLVDTDISSEPAEVQAVCNAVWTTDICTPPH